MCREKVMWGHSKKAAFCKQRRAATSETNPAETLILDSQPLELPDNKLFLLKPPSVWYFVMPAQAN